MSNAIWLLSAGGIVVLTMLIVLSAWPRRRDLGSVSDRWIQEHRGSEPHRSI